MDEATKEILDGISSFIDSMVVPLEKKNAHLFDNSTNFYAANGAYTEPVRELLKEVRERSAEAGYYGMFAPEEVGGAGLGPSMLYEVWHHIYSKYGPGRILPAATVAHWSYGPSVLCSYLTPEAKAEMLDDFMGGTTTSCFGMSEPNAGSDSWAMSTAAYQDGDEWVITGSKQWITNSPEADWVFVWAVTDNELRKQRKGGISCFLVPTTAPGFALDSVISLFGQAGGHEGIISFTDVRVPASALVGELHNGFALAMAGVSTGRLYNAGRCVGLARWAMNLAAEFSTQRYTFGHPISDYQGVSFQLADCAIDIYAGDTMARECAARLESGARAHDQIAMAKVYTTEMCSRVYERCMQIHGGMGLTNEMKLYDGWHQARIVRIADGSAEILRRNIARAVIGGKLRRDG
jgi:acyl-CoA dehydrogenase